MAATKHARDGESLAEAARERPSKKAKVKGSSSAAADVNKLERRAESKRRHIEKKQRRRAEKDRAKQQRREEKLQRRQEQAAAAEAIIAEAEVAGAGKESSADDEAAPETSSEHAATAAETHTDEPVLQDTPPPAKVEKKRKPASSSGPAAVRPTRPYKQSKALRALPQADIDSYMKTHSIIVTDPRSDAPKLRPIMHFSDLPSTQLLGKAPFAAFKAPTPIQAASWPFTLSGRDLIGVAETGSGKTMAFALPCVESVLSTAAKGAVGAVIVSPTRELAMQTHDQMTTLADLVGLNCVCLFGGASKTTQRAILDKGVDIIVATPGRLKDFMSDGTVSLAEAAFVVLDEADRMLDTGFEQDIKDILSTAPPREQRQTMMFTATWPASVQALASSFMVDPVKIAIGSGGKETVNGAVELQANARIAQHVEVIDHHAKEARLLQILKQRQQGKARNDRILVFCLYKKEAVRVENFLRQRGVRVASIHGDLPQEKRTKSLEAFKSGHTPVLVATDVAARGLDIPEVKLVINVTFPLTIEDYVHRIGRTGRAGNDGEAITLFTEGDKSHSGSLINILRSAKQPVPDELLKFGTTVKKKAHTTYGAFFKDVDMTKVSKKITFDD